MNHIHKNGFTLFYALLVASLALAIGAAIFDITEREITLSGEVTQSQYAVYAADSGAECALYWDNKYVNGGTNNNGGSNSIFATSSTDTLGVVPTSGQLCNNTDITASASANWTVTTSASAATTTFTFNTAGAAFHLQTPCATVQVVKSGNPSVTTITSQGFNTCTAGPQQLERVLQVSY